MLLWGNHTLGPGSYFRSRRSDLFIKREVHMRANTKMYSLTLLRAMSVCALMAQCWGHFLVCDVSGNSTQEENSISVWCVTMAMSQAPAPSLSVNRWVSAQLRCWKRFRFRHFNLKFAFSNRPWHPVEALFVWLDAMAVYQSRLCKKDSSDCWQACWLAGRRDKCFVSSSPLLQCDFPETPWHGGISSLFFGCSQRPWHPVLNDTWVPLATQHGPVLKGTIE